MNDEDPGAAGMAGCGCMLMLLTSVFIMIKFFKTLWEWL